MALHTPSSSAALALLFFNFHAHPLDVVTYIQIERILMNDIRLSESTHFISGERVETFEDVIDDAHHERTNRRLFA